MSKAFVAVTLLALTLLFSGCDNSDPDGEGGIIGTGIIPLNKTIRGTTSSPRMLATNLIEVKSSDGQTASIELSAGNRFFIDEAPGQGPWILRAELGNDLALYGIAFDSDSEDPSNINSYSDVILRNWFARQGQDLDALFDGPGGIDNPPSEAEFNANASQLFRLLALLFESNSIEGQQLLTGDFAADNQSIDNFLNTNPVVIDDGKISILITDPDSETQSQIQSQLELDANLGQDDSNPPTIPGNVRALGSAIDEILVVWDPSLDNLGVLGYDVFRDGTQITTTPYPVFTDSGLQANQSAVYEIVAIDAAGNRSARSIATSGVTLAQPDNQAPPTPTSFFELGATETTIDLIWGIGDVADVAGFNIYRGTTSDGLPFLVKITSTPWSDTTISSGSTYCYQVSAVDASGNESPRSDVLCVNSSGSTNSTGGDNTGPPAAFYTELNVPDTVSLTCDQQLQPADLAQSLTLGPGCYTVAEDLALPQFTRLTIQAGTVLKFAQNTHLLVGRNSSLTANGTIDEPVVFTGAQDFPGYWEGLRFEYSDSPANLLRNTVVEYAGGGEEQQAAVYIRSGDNQFTRLRMENSLIHFSSGYGLDFVWNGTILESFTANRITNNRRPAAFTLDLLGSTAGTNDYTGNELNWIGVPRNVFGKDITIGNPGIPIRSGGMTIIDSSVTVEAGVTLLMGVESVFTVSGGFRSLGTAENPVNIRGWQTEPGSWIGFVLSGSTPHEFTHTTIENAGEGGDGNGAIRLDCSEAEPASLSLSDTSISGSTSWGIALAPNGCTLNVGSGVTFSNNVLGPINSP